MSGAIEELLNRIAKQFRIKKQKVNQHQFALTRWKNGYWSIVITDDWHKWSKEGLLHKDEMNMIYATPEMACEAFLKFIKDNDLNIKQLQEDD